MSLTMVEEAVLNKMFTFQLFNVVFVTAAAGSVMAVLDKVVKNPGALVDLLGTSLPNVRGSRVQARRSLHPTLTGHEAARLVPPPPGTDELLFLQLCPPPGDDDGAPGAGARHVTVQSLDAPRDRGDGGAAAGGGRSGRCLGRIRAGPTLCGVRPSPRAAPP